MPPLSSLWKFRRAALVTAFSVLLFGFCAALAWPKDQGRFLNTLHAAHKGQRYQEALTRLRAEIGVDECSVCHMSSGPVQNLVEARAGVEDFACMRCHSTAKTAPGRPLGIRLRRPAHNDMITTVAAAQQSGQPAEGGKTAPAALWVAPKEHPEAPLACAACHPDHEGDMKHAEVEGTQKPVLFKECLGCHVPGSPDAESQAVLKNFAEKHGGTGETPDAIMKSVEMDACTGTCHYEHTKDPSMSDERKADAGRFAPYLARR